MNSPDDLVMWLYVYCTDFVLNLANLTGLSYYEINFLLFCVLYPMLLIGSIGWYGAQLQRIKRLSRAGATIKK